MMLDGKTFKAHRLAWLYVYGYFPSGNIDHINGNKLDNRICNLRDVNCKTNCENSIVPKGSNKYRGVTFDKRKGKFDARIINNRVLKYLGSFDTAEQARDAYLDAKIKIHVGFVS